MSLTVGAPFKPVTSNTNVSVPSGTLIGEPLTHQKFAELETQFPDTILVQPVLVFEMVTFDAPVN
jgi:hypothetical protein